MPTVQFCGSFVKELLTATHDFSVDTFKMALYPAAAALTVSTTAYSATGEVANGNGYTTAGASAAVSSTYPLLSSNVAQVRFDTVSWTFLASTTLRYGLLYNTSKSNKAVAVLDFGADLSVTGSFQISFPLTVDPFITVRVPVLT